jgi:hypothetical protein
MSRSQRHKILVENYPSDCKVTAEHVISPGYLRQTGGPPFTVPMGPAGGPLQGSSLAGPAPSTLPNPILALAILIAANRPVLTSLNPDTAVLGSADIVLHCIGSNFTEASIIHFSDQDEPTTFVSDTEVTTGVKPSLGWGAVSLPVYVKTGPVQSDTLQFTFTDAAAGTTGTRTFPIGPIALAQISYDSNDGELVFEMASDPNVTFVEVGDTVRVEATGTTAVNKDYVVTALSDPPGTFWAVGDDPGNGPIVGKGRVTVIGGA